MNSNMLENNSYDSSRTSSGSCSCPSRKEPDVTVDDVAVVVAGLNDKVVQLRREILELRGCPSSQESKGRYLSREYGKLKISASRESLREREEYFTQRRRKHEESKSSGKDSRLKFSRRRDKPAKLSVKELKREEYTPKSNYSQPTRKNSKFAFIPADNFSDHDKTSRILYEGRKERQKVLKSSSDEYEDKKRVAKASESPDRVDDRKSNVNLKSQRRKPHRISEGKQSRLPDKILSEETRFVKKEKHVDSSKARKISKPNKKDSPDNKEMTKRLNPVNYSKRLATKKEEEKDRIVLPSRMSLKCQGIRHAFGLSNAHCDCVTTGSGVRRVKKKRISRGVQCDRSDICKRKSSRFCGFFASKCCTKKPNKSHRKKSKNSLRKTESVASSEIYKPKNETKNKKTADKEVMQHEMFIDKRRRNQRMSGGGEEIWSHRWNTNEINSIDKNDILYVKQRLNECLIELNGIIGDVGFIFEKN